MFRILSIDGGGMKGVFPASFLATIEKTIEGPIGEYFDLIAGTSTGGILALGLGLGFQASELLELYRGRGNAIFPPSINERIRHWLRSRNRYSPEPLRAALTDVFGQKLLG